MTQLLDYYGTELFSTQKNIAISIGPSGKQRAQNFYATHSMLICFTIWLIWLFISFYLPQNFLASVTHISTIMLPQENFSKQSHRLTRSQGPPPHEWDIIFVQNFLRWRCEPPSHLLLHSLPIIFPLPFYSYLLLLSSFCFPTSLSLMFLLLISLPFSQLLFYLCPFSFCSLSQLLFCNSRIIRTKIRRMRMSVKRALCFDFNLLLSFEGRHRDL